MILFLFVFFKFEFLLLVEAKHISSLCGARLNLLSEVRTENSTGLTTLDKLKLLS